MGWASPEHVWTEASSINKITEENKVIFEIPPEYYYCNCELSTCDSTEGCCTGSSPFGIWDAGSVWAGCVKVAVLPQGRARERTLISHVWLHLERCLRWKDFVSDLLKFNTSRCFLCSRKIPAVLCQCSANEGESVFYLCYHGKLTTIQPVIYG